MGAEKQYLDQMRKLKVVLTTISKASPGMVGAPVHELLDRVAPHRRLTKAEVSARLVSKSPQAPLCQRGELNEIISKNPPFVKGDRG